MGVWGARGGGGSASQLQAGTAYMYLLAEHV